MRTTGRIIAASALLSGGLLFAGPAAAVTATPCPYPFVNCPTPSATPTTPPAIAPPTTPPAIAPPATPTTPPASVTPTTPPASVTPTTPPTPTTTPSGIGGGDGGPGSGETPAGGGPGGGSTVSDNSPVQGSAQGAAGLPFTGGEVALIALAGVAALGGGAVLVAAGRKRAQA